MRSGENLPNRGGPHIVEVGLAILQAVHAHEGGRGRCPPRPGGGARGDVVGRRLSTVAPDIRFFQPAHVSVRAAPRLAMAAACVLMLRAPLVSLLEKSGHPVALATPVCSGVEKRTAAHRRPGPWVKAAR